MNFFVQKFMRDEKKLSGLAFLIDTFVVFRTLFKFSFDEYLNTELHN